jgi:hypothetical protein
MSEKIIYWDEEGTEKLSYTDKDEAIYYILDGLNLFADFPETLEICGYAREEITEGDINHYVNDVIEKLLECMDDDYNSLATEISLEMKEVTRKFVLKIVSLYTVWNCHIVARETINVKDWIQKHNPEWLKND